MKKPINYLITKPRSRTLSEINSGERKIQVPHEVVRYGIAF